MYWTKIHADWWCNELGDDIHRYEILDDEDRRQVEYHIHHAGERLPWSGKTHTLAEAQRQLEHSHRAFGMSQDTNHAAMCISDPRIPSVQG